ncbi:MAG: hypothetical protein NVS9B15_20430 [Acidobacteriaceae bacterium]
MTRIFGYAIAALVIPVLALNALFMLISPRAWFRLPHWLLAKGALTEKRYANGFGALQLQMAGAIILVTLAWIIYSLCSNR